MGFSSGPQVAFMRVTGLMESNMAKVKHVIETETYGLVFGFKATELKQIINACSKNVGILMLKHNLYV